MQTAPDNVIQLNFFDVWWGKASLWSNYSDDETVDRPAEIEAIQCIRRQALALVRGDYRFILSPLEKELHDFELYLLRHKPHFRSPMERARYMVENKHRTMTPRQILSILDRVSHVIDAWAIQVEMELLYAKVKAVKEVWQETVAEQGMDVAAAA